MKMFAAIFTLALLGSQGSLAADLTSGCGSEKQCFLEPEGCSGSACEYAVTWTPNGDYVDFVVGTNVAALGDDVYIAVGVGPQPVMDGGSVMDCIHYANTAVTQLSYNDGKTNEVLPEPSYTSSDGLDIISLSSGEITNGFLECSFSRKAEVTSDERVLSLNSPNQYYITVARGTASSQTVKDYHGADKVASTSTYDFMAPAASSNDALTPDAIQATCGVTAGCFASPAGCTGTSCDYLVAYAPQDDAIVFTASARIPADLGENAYVSIGLGSEPKMDGSTVVDCIHYGGDINFQFSFNMGYQNLLGVQLVDQVLTDMSGSFADEFLTCTYTRPISLPGNNAQFADLSQPDAFYLLVAVGSASSATMKEYHAGNKVVSPETIDFLSVGANSASSPAPPAPSGNTVADEIQATCGDTAGCYSSPDGCSGSTCSYLVAYTQKDDVIEFAATGLVPSDLGEDFYLTVGVGPEPVMDGSTVVDCIMYNGDVSFQFSFNDGHSNVNADTPVDGILTDMDASYEDGFFTCKYSRPVTVADFSDVPDLSVPDAYYILVAMGTTTSATDKDYHGSNRVASGVTINFQEAGESSGVYISRMLKAHGAVMIVAWVFLAGYGLMSSRYFKGIYPDNKIRGLDFWFVSHRTSFQVSAALTLIGVIIIFLYISGWSDLSDRSPSVLKAHPTIGVIVMVLVFLNPVLAYFRPGKNDDKRPLFNWVHRIIGQSAFVLALLNNALGFLLLPVVSKLGLLCLFIFIGFHALCEVIMLAQSWGCCGKGENEESQPIVGNGGGLREAVKKSMFWIYTLGTLVLTVFMLIGIIEI